MSESVPLQSPSSVINAVKELGNWLIADTDRETKNRQKLFEKSKS